MRADGAHLFRFLLLKELNVRAHLYQNIENIAWLRINSQHTISGLKLWDNGRFYCEILSMDQEEPVLAELRDISTDETFSDAFQIFFDKISAIERQAIITSARKI